MTLPRFFQFENYEVKDVKEFLSKGLIEVHLSRDKAKPSICHRCNKLLTCTARGSHSMTVEAMPITGYRTFLVFRRYKYHCEFCKKARSEDIPFISVETPHLTRELAWWIGRLCEIASVTRVGELVGHDGMTTWRLDYNRMVQMLKHYRLPNLKRLSVDEVYARRKKRFTAESRDKLFFTVITDLETRKVIWVSDGRSKESLDNFFMLLGEEACKEIEVVAMDQHNGYFASVQQNCPNATIVWDKFHILQSFEEVVNETRMEIHQEIPNGHKLKLLTKGRNKYIFLKRDSSRTSSEKRLIEEVVKENETFFRLELIKERMLTMFNEADESKALFIWSEIGDWIKRSRFKILGEWYDQLNRNWKTVANYFKYRVTTSVSEGINNVIKTLKRRAYGYRNMRYFKLKILQVCGYLNSRYIKTTDQLLTQI